MYRAGRLRRVFRARGKLVGTSDFVVTKGYVQIRVVGFPWETASLEAVVRCQDGALLLRRERAEARLRWLSKRSTKSLRVNALLTQRRHSRTTPPPRLVSASPSDRSVSKGRESRDAAARSAFASPFGLRYRCLGPS